MRVHADIGFATDAIDIRSGVAGYGRDVEPVRHSIIVPVYNSGHVLPTLYARLVAVMEACGAPFELVFVDDHSADDSWAALERIAKRDHRVLALQLERNVGQGMATMLGLRRAAGEVLITLDDDLQHPPEEIPKLLAELTGSNRFDVVFGIPIRRRSSVWRRCASWLFNHMIRLALRRRNGVKNSGFRAIRRSMVQRLPSEADSGPLISALLFQSSDRIGMVRVSHQPSALPASRYTPWSLLTLSFGVVAHLGRVAAGRSGVSEPASAEREAHHAAFVRRAIRAGQEQASRA